MTASGTTTETGGSLFAEGGATLTLPELTSFLSGSSFTTTVEATGDGSVLTLANTTSLTVPTAFPSQAEFEALGGGTLYAGGANVNQRLLGESGKRWRRQHP